MKAILDNFFRPKSIAVVGATEAEGKVGQAVFNNLLQFGQALYPVNPKYSKLMGLKCYKSLAELPQAPDLVIIATPAATVPDIIEQCGRKGSRSAMILSSGFREAGTHGVGLYKEMMHHARKHGVRIIGPNCMGLQTPELKLNATFSPALPAPGRVAFISQSGALGSAILDWAASKNVGFSYFVSLGNMADIGFDQLIDYFGADSRTSCILLYMESLSNARKFMSAARAFARSKPVVVLKAGASAEGARAALSHTGAMAGNDAVFDAAFQRAGVIRVRNIQQLFDVAQALAMQPPPPGKRLAVVTNAGGPGILATDALIRAGGTLAPLAPETIEKLDAILPDAWSKGNPVDVMGDAKVEHYSAALRACLFDPNVDAVLSILTAQSVTDPEAVAKMVVKDAKAVFNKPVYTSWMGYEAVLNGRQVLEKGKVPWYPFPERAVDTFMHMVRYRENLDMLYEMPPDLPIEFPDMRRDDARKLVERVQAQGRTEMNEIESKELLACYGIPVNLGRVARSAEEAAELAQNIGFPVAMKIESPDIWHKLDVGGVFLNVATPQEAAEAYRYMFEHIPRRRPDARLTGVSIEKMQKNLHEVLIGSVKDPVFGPVIVFGLGGSATEIWKDRTIGLPPLNLALAKHLIEGAKVAQLLKGYRHLPPAPMALLQTVICRFAYLIMDLPEVREFDINPFAMSAESGFALDAACTLERSPARHKNPYEHLCILPYPTQWIKEVPLRNGQKAIFRPIRPEDEPMEAEMARNSSRESLYFRFFGYVPGIDHKFLSRMTNIDYDREMAIVAQVELDGETKIAGMVQIVGDGWRETAEYAILVADQWQNLGLGGLLTDYIIEIARKQGYKKIVASFLKVNGSMRRLFERKGFKISAGAEDSDWAELSF